MTFWHFYKFFEGATIKSEHKYVGNVTLFGPLCKPESAQATYLKVYRVSHLNFVTFGTLKSHKQFLFAAKAKFCLVTVIIKYQGFVSVLQSLATSHCFTTINFFYCFITYCLVVQENWKFGIVSYYSWIGVFVIQNLSISQN